jgi:hypothetical protein
MGGPAIVDRLFQSIQHEAGMRCPAGPPPYDPARKGVDNKGYVDEPRPCREWSRKRMSASPPRTVRAPFSAYGSLFNLGPRPWQHHDNGR